MSAVREKIDWLIVKENIANLSYLDRAISWILLLCSKIAEPILFFGAVYAGIKLYMLFPGWLETLWIVSQSLGLDIAGPGAFLIARQAFKDGDSRRGKWAIAMGVTLVLLAIINMATGGVTHVYNIPESQLPGWYIIGLLVIRATIAVGYTTVCRLSFSGHKQDTQLVRAATVDQRYEELARLFLQVETRLKTRIEEIENENERRVEGFNSAFNETLQAFQLAFQSALTESSDRLQSAFQFAMMERLEAFHERLSIIDGSLSILPELKGQIERQTAILPAIKPAVQLPSKQPGKPVETESVDRESFVFQCLDENPELSISDIIERAKLKGLTLSTGTVSRYRAAFKNRQIERENETSVERN